MWVVSVQINMVIILVIIFFHLLLLVSIEFGVKSDFRIFILDNFCREYLEYWIYLDNVGLLSSSFLRTQIGFDIANNSAM